MSETKESEATADDLAEPPDADADAEPETDAATEADADAESDADDDADADDEADDGVDADAADDAADDADDDAADEDGESESPPAPPPLVTPGNPPRIARGASALAVGALVALVLMALRPQYRIGVPLGFFAILVATFGALDLGGTFDDPDERVAKRLALADLGLPLGLLGGSVLGVYASISLAVEGYIGPILAGIAVPLCFLGAVLGVYRVGERLGVWEKSPSGESIPLVRRHGFWLVTLVTLLYLPTLGSHSLSDPWETHYGEVAREILARNDWISLWWAQDGWFWSKPILDFWMQALAMATFGVRYRSGAMLSAVAEGREPWPEWAVRLPIFLLTLVATYLLYKAVARVFGRRAGFFGGLVLSTMPQWFLVSHQTMTDMPFVSTMSAAMALVLLGIHEDKEREVRVYEVRAFGQNIRLSAYHLVLGAIIACALPQILYLISRNLEIVPSPFSFRFHVDAFRSGSPQNCGLPGNQPCADALPVLRGLQPSLQAVLWIQALGILLYASWGERRAQRLFFLAAWFFAALSTMAKGPAGIGLPALCALVYIIVSRRWRDLLRLEIVAGLLILLAVATPWFLAMFARHGQPFTDRLFFHDMFKRAFTHVHDTNDGDDVGFRYYIWQLGYAMFPWTGLAPAALVSWLRRREDDDPKSDASIFLVMWFVLAYAGFTVMLTKFHHYILPALPPAAMLTGILLDEMVTRSGRLGAGESFVQKYERVVYGAAAVAGGFLVLLVGRDLAGAREGMLGAVRLLHLFTYNYKRPFPPTLDFRTPLLVFACAAGLFTFALVVARARRHVVTGLCVVGVLFAAWGIDVYFMKTSPHWGQRHTVLAYVKANTEIPGPIVAYQMNWKGENFYNGNAIPAFVSSGKKFQDYMLDQKKKGIRTFYFMTEHGRMGSLANELGGPRHFEKLTTPELNNKFGLVRVKFD